MIINFKEILDLLSISFVFLILTTNNKSLENKEKNLVVDISNISEVKKKIADEGMLFFENTFETLTFDDFCKSLGEIYFHTDSNDVGITIVKNKMKEKVFDGYQGLSSGNLFPHTDRSTILTPPNLLALYCKKQSGYGGETILIDSKKVLSAIIEKFGLDSPFLDINNVIFSDPTDSHKGNIFERYDDGSYFTRFRNDKFAYFNSKIIEFLPDFYRLLDENSFILKLEEGQGYIINNGRYLHGRNSYSGEREMWRILLTSNFLDTKGFIL